VLTGRRGDADSKRQARCNGPSSGPSSGDADDIFSEDK
jgi:hypothetical protein